MVMSDDLEIKYTVKERLEQLRREATDGFDRIERKLDAIASANDTRFQRVEARVDALERDRSDKQQWLGGASKVVVLGIGFVAWAAPMAIVLLK